MESDEVSKNEQVKDIESNTMGDIKVEDLITASDTNAAGEVNFEDLENRNDPKTAEEKSHDKVLDDIICKALGKVKEYFFQNDLEESKIAEFLFKILTLNAKDSAKEDFTMSPDLLNQVVEQMLESNGTISEPDKFSDIIDNLFGAEAAKALSEKLCTEKIDDIVERLFGEETKKLICEKLQSEDLDEMLNKLVDEKLELDEDPESKHPNFDDFIQKILRKESESFIRQKLEAFFNDIKGPDCVEDTTSTTASLELD